MRESTQNIVDRLRKIIVEKSARNQGEKLVLILGVLAKLTPNGIQDLQNVTFNDGFSVMVSTDRELIEKTNSSPGIRRIIIDNENTVWVNITMSMSQKKKIIDIVASGMGYSAHVRNQLKSLMDIDEPKKISKEILDDLSGT